MCGRFETHRRVLAVFCDSASGLFSAHYYVRARQRHLDLRRQESEMLCRSAPSMRTWTYVRPSVLYTDRLRSLLKRSTAWGPLGYVGRSLDFTRCYRQSKILVAGLQSSGFVYSISCHPPYLARARSQKINRCPKERWIQILREEVLTACLRVGRMKPVRSYLKLALTYAR